MKIMSFSPKTILRFFNFWPPYLASGISVKEYDLDQGYVITQLKIHFWNANAFGTMYGGSLFSMCDPFYVFILANLLGRDYIIWDFESSIRFIKATSRPVTAKFEVTPERVAEIREKTQSGKKIFPVFETKIIDPDGEVVAEVKKTLYLKLKPSKRPALNSPTE